MPVRHAICIAIDGLRASALGAYGNTWHPTPALDLLASQSCVVDWMLCHRPTLAGFYESAWRAAEGSLIERLATAGVQASLTTDDALVAAWAEAAGFAEIRRIEFTAENSAATVAETELAQLFAVAIDQLTGWSATSDEDDSVPPRLLWMHARGFHGAWDAPLEFRESLLDEEDPPAPTFVTSPALDAAGDQDALLLSRAAYAAQTMVLDECVDALLAALVNFGLDDCTLVVLVGARGFALGEHGVVGGDATAPYGELVHVPCLVRAPESAGPPPRLLDLSIPADLQGTLSLWFDESLSKSTSRTPCLLAEADIEPASRRQFVIATADDGVRSIRTPAWMLLERPASEELPAGAADSTVELYRKPDDRWEANEIADRCPDIVEGLLAALDGASAGGETAPNSAPLDDQLVAHPR